MKIINICRMLAGILVFLVFMGVVLADAVVKLQITKKSNDNATFKFVCNKNGIKGPATYDMDFKDGTIIFDSHSRAFFHTYTSNGVYTPTCTVTDRFGNSYFGYKELKVTDA